MFIYSVLHKKWFLTLLLFSNVIGTVYGYWWYRGQLIDTEWYFYPFVPDSPTATLFLSIFILLILTNKRCRIIEALAFTTLIKYGVWAVIMNILTFMESGFVTWIGLMLIVSHSIMAIQAFMFLPFMDVKLIHLLITAVWLFHNDVIDYVYKQFPKYGYLNSYYEHIGYFSFWLSIGVLALLYIYQVKRID